MPGTVLGDRSYANDRDFSDDSRHDSSEGWSQWHLQWPRWRISIGRVLTARCGRRGCAIWGCLGAFELDVGGGDGGAAGRSDGLDWGFGRPAGDLRCLTTPATRGGGRRVLEALLELHGRGLGSYRWSRDKWIMRRLYLGGMGCMAAMTMWGLIIIGGVYHDGICDQATEMTSIMKKNMVMIAILDIKWKMVMIILL